MRVTLAVLRYVDPENLNLNSILDRIHVGSKWLTPFKNEVINNDKIVNGAFRSFKIDGNLPRDEFRTMQT